MHLQHPSHSSKTYRKHRLPSIICGYHIFLYVKSTISHFPNEQPALLSSLYYNLPFIITTSLLLHATPPPRPGTPVWGYKESSQTGPSNRVITRPQRAAITTHYHTLYHTPLSPHAVPHAAVTTRCTTRRITCRYLHTLYHTPLPPHAVPHAAITARCTTRRCHHTLYHKPLSPHSAVTTRCTTRRCHHTPLSPHAGKLCAAATSPNLLSLSPSHLFLDTPLKRLIHIMLAISVVFITTLL